MRNQAPAVAIRVVRSRFLSVVLMLGWLLLLGLLTFIWGQGNLSQWALAFAMISLLGLAWCLFRCYQQFFVGKVTWTGHGWVLRPKVAGTADDTALISAGMACVWDGQAHLLVRADNNWIWLDAVMCSPAQWLALRRALLVAPFAHY